MPLKCSNFIWVKDQMNFSWPVKDISEALSLGTSISINNCQDLVIHLEEFNLLHLEAQSVVHVQVVSQASFGVLLPIKALLMIIVILYTCKIQNAIML